MAEERMRAAEVNQRVQEILREKEDELAEMEKVESERLALAEAERLAFEEAAVAHGLLRKPRRLTNTDRR